MVGTETLDGLYESLLQVIARELACATRALTENPDIGLQRFGHVNNDVIAKCLSHLRGMQKKKVGLTSACDRCAVSKLLGSPRKSLSLEKKRSGKVLQGCALTWSDH